LRLLTDGARLTVGEPRPSGLLLALLACRQLPRALLPRLLG